MKERPIPFTEVMVQAILQGRKTQTRRVCKVKPVEGSLDNYSDDALAAIVQHNSPFGVPGDRLWVKETYALHVIGDHLPPSCFCHDHQREPIWYKADGKPEMVLHEGMPDIPGKWRALRFMPKRCARLWLEVTELRVERVQGINREGIKAEGSKVTHLAYGDDGNPVGFQADYGVLWDALNAKRGFGWKTNPWVWVITFRRL